MRNITSASVKANRSYPHPHLSGFWFPLRHLFQFQNVRTTTLVKTHTFGHRLSSFGRHENFAARSRLLHVRFSNRYKETLWIKPEEVLIS